jgi:hypothetical protein
MSYLLCDRCGLQIKIQATFMHVENCPRCLARTATVSPLVQSAKWSRPAAGWGRERDERADKPTGGPSPA